LGQPLTGLDSPQDGVRPAADGFPLMLQASMAATRARLAARSGLAEAGTPQLMALKLASIKESTHPGIGTWNHEPHEG
jgi:hypothetical protein